MSQLLHWLPLIFQIANCKITAGSAVVLVSPWLDYGNYVLISY